MNSSVTFDSEISVMSSLCLLISCSSRSNGPSKLTRWTLNPLPDDESPSGSSVGRSIGRSVEVSAMTDLLRGSPEPLHQHRVGTVVDEVGQQYVDRLADDPPAVGGQAVLGAERESGLFESEQLFLRHVHGDLRVVPDPATGLAVLDDGGPGPAGGSRSVGQRGSVGGGALLGSGLFRCRTPEQLAGTWQAHPAGQRASTSLARSRYWVAAWDEGA